MKEKGTCSYSKCNKTFFKRNYRQHACCASHRTLSNREKGTAKPNPYTNNSTKNSLLSNSANAAVAAAIPKLLQNDTGSNILSGVGTAIITNAAVPKVLDGIKSGYVKPIPAGAGAIGGYFVSGFFTKNPLLRILAALGTGYATNEFFRFTSVETMQGDVIQDMYFTELPENEVKTPLQFSDIVNSRDYRKINIPTLELDNKYSNLFGNPSSNFYMMVHGLPSQGKTHWVVKFADYFNRNIGNAIYYAAEHNGIDKHFQSILNKTKSSFDVQTNPASLSEQQIINDFNKYSLVVIDSAQTLNISPEKLKAIRDKSKAATIVILQSNKEGDFKGSQTWFHDADISVRMESRTPMIEKSRFGGNRGGSIEPGKVINM